MGTSALSSLPDHSFAFIDANIFIYGISGVSQQCRHFLDRCFNEEVTGIALFETVNEATHRFMLAEAHAKGLIRHGSARHLRQNFGVIPQLTDYWRNVQTLLSLNLVFLPVNETIVVGAQPERQGAALLTNDSLIVSCMRQCGVSSLATSDLDFERVAGITIFRPTDLP